MARKPKTTDQKIEAAILSFAKYRDGFEHTGMVYNGVDHFFTPSGDEVTGKKANEMVKAKLGRTIKKIKELAYGEIMFRVN